ncbi:MAG: hypothetical protein ACRCXQ_09450 [Vagococcus fluvialis]
MKKYFFQFLREKLNVMSDEFLEKHRRYRLKMPLSDMDKKEVEGFIKKYKKEWELIK